MKNLKVLGLIGFGLLLFACSSDDDAGGGGTPTPVTGNYFPSTLADFWTYSVANRNADDPSFNFDATDAVEVDSSTGENFTVSTNPNPANGRMNAFLADGVFLPKGF